METENGNVQENRYDTEGLRFELLENGRRTSFVFHNGELLHEEGRDENQTCYHLGAGIDAFQRGEETYYYHRDEQLSTVFITGRNGEANNSYQYDAFGAEMEATEQLSNRIRYTGQQYDSLTEQYYLRARYYNPVLGRFMQEDVYQGDGLNLYAYCANNPVVYYDPSGYKSKVKCVNDNTSSGTTDDSASSSRTVTNSAGQEVTREYVKDQDELLEQAEAAAGGNLDDFIEIKPNWYQNKERTIKIEWNPEGHANTNEGPHVTVRVRNERNAWSVIKKIFIEGWDNYKK